MEKGVNSGNLVSRDKLDTWIKRFLEFFRIHGHRTHHVNSESPKEDNVRGLTAVYDRLK